MYQVPYMYRYVHDTGSAYRYRVEFDWCMLTSRARTLALHAGRVLVRWGGLAARASGDGIAARGTYRHMARRCI